MRKSARTGSRRQSGRNKSKEGIVTKRKAAQKGSKPKSTAKDMSPVYKRKLETARQFCATIVGDEEIRAMIDGLGQQRFEVAVRLLEWDGVNERLGVIFGSEYANDRLHLAVTILFAHKAYLNSVEREKRRAKRELAQRRVHGQKPPFHNRHGSRAA